MKLGTKNNALRISVLPSVESAMKCRTSLFIRRSDANNLNIEEGLFCKITTGEGKEVREYEVCPVESITATLKGVQFDIETFTSAVYLEAIQEETGEYQDVVIFLPMGKSPKSERITVGRGYMYTLLSLLTQVKKGEVFDLTVKSKLITKDKDGKELKAPYFDTSAFVKCFSSEEPKGFYLKKVEEHKGLSFEFGSVESQEFILGCIDNIKNNLK